jgi:hypothetical protein
MWAVSGKCRKRITFASVRFDSHLLLAQTQGRGDLNDVQRPSNA